MGSEDDTRPVIAPDTLIEFESIELAVGEKGEIILAPESLMRDPVLFMSDKGSEVLVEEIFHGQAALTRHGRWPVSIFKQGHRLGVAVDDVKPLKVVVMNVGPEPTTVSASLVSERKR